MTNPKTKKAQQKAKPSTDNYIEKNETENRKAQNPNRAKDTKYESFNI